MEQRSVLKGVPGILRPFREYIEGLGLSAGDQVVYCGVPGTCTPFVELLAFAIRSLPVQQVFVPGVDAARARRLDLVPYLGMQGGDEPEDLHPSVIVIMGGLSMENSGVSHQDVTTFLDQFPTAMVAGVCFQQMFEKAGWCTHVPFDLVIDATIDPVVVWSE